MELMEALFAIVTSLLSVCVIGFFKTLYKEKAKNRALIEDVGRIEAEKQRVVHDFTLETERIKQIHAKEIERLKQQSAERLDKQRRDHEIDIQKRKYKYENKSREYHKFMDELDSFRGLNVGIIENELRPMINACFASDYGISNKLFVEANDKATAIISSVRAQEAKLFAQVNGVKLNATQEIIDLLGELQANITQSKFYLEEVIGYIFSEEFRYTKRIPDEINAKAVGLNHRTADMNKNLLAALRADLDTL
ncbi:hypothetical protein [Pseudomonas aeruginosa]|uniref:hypothetical protein n=1 Tax=Pseudomonas aeruginosa TaxID=287 RepID=UPI002E1A885B